MLGFVYQTERPSPEHKLELVAVGDWKAMTDAYGQVNVLDRNSLKSFELATIWAADATELTGDLHLPVDSGPHVYPRYDVVRAPKVGTFVSYGFNGDYYPDGEITYVTPKTAFLVRTSSGKTYRRSGKRGQWLQTGGTWSLIEGRHDRRNPSF